jgi:hypothetical protein
VLHLLDGVGDRNAARARFGTIENGLVGPDDIVIAQDAQLLSRAATRLSKMKR